MYRTRHQLALVLTVLVVLVLSAIRTVPVYADDGAPPPESSPTEAAPPATGDASTTDVAPVETATDTATEAPTEVVTATDPAPTDVVVTDVPPTDAAPADPVVEEVAPTEAAPADPVVTDVAPTEAAPADAVVEPAPVAVDPAPDATVSDVLAQAPEGTEVVVVNADGESVPLASQEAADIIATGDPMWCPVGVTPSLALMPPTCHNSGTLKGLVTSFSPTVAGVIWITEGSMGTDSGGAVTIDGSGTWSGAAAFPLVLNGGWTGTGTTLNASDPSLFSNSSISIVNWGGTVTLNNITISDVTSGQALNVQVSGNGNIVLKNVHVEKNTGAKGAKLDNSSLTGTHLGTVSVTDSSFNQNTGGDGLTIYSDKAVTLKDIDANMNGAPDPAYVQGYGAYIDNCNWDDVDHCQGSGAVTLTGLNTFSDNSYGGLYVTSNGAITASNVVANSNTEFRGAWLTNCHAEIADLADSCENVTAVAPVTLTGTNEFKFNHGGLAIITNGAITVSNATATDSTSGSGFWLSNKLSPVVGGANVTLTGINTSNDNAGGGYWIYSTGAVTIANLIAMGNDADYGAYIDNTYAATPKPVTLSVSGTNLTNNASWNTNHGLYIASKGAISITGLVAHGNGGYGAYLDNSGTGAVGGISLIGLGVDASNNQTGAGLEVYSKGLISIANLNASGNGDEGAVLDNSAGTAGITLTGSNYFDWNIWNGVRVLSRGPISLSNMDASNNGGTGAYIDNSTGTVAAAVVISNTPTFYPAFNWNGDDGLNVYSLGTITIGDLDASNNGQSNFEAAKADGTIVPDYGWGVYLRSYGPAGNVSIGTTRANWCNSAIDNFQTGMDIMTNGNVKLSNVCNGGNGGFQVADSFDGDPNTVGFDPNIDFGFGLLINNTGGGSARTVTLTGNNDFYSNFDTGLWIETSGSITISNLTANDNYGHTLDNFSRVARGAVLGLNSFTDFPKPLSVTITGYASFWNNYSSGLEVQSLGAISLANVDSHDNGKGGFGYGAYLDNCGYDYFDTLTCSQTLVKPVTLTGYNNFNWNTTGGLEVHSLGAVTINELHANNNPGFGALINNEGSNGSTYLGTGGFTLTGNSDEHDNGGFGLDVKSRGAITITLGDMWAGNNGGFGWSLDNSKAATPMAITLSSPNTDWAFDFDTNTNFGFQALSKGNITIAGLDVYNTVAGLDDSGFGALLENDFLGATGTITLTGPVNGDNYFGSNDAFGLVVLSNRAITLGKVSASDNKGLVGGGFGALIDNSTGSGNVTIVGFGHFYNNAGFGLDITSNGLISLAMVDASDNLDYGAYLDNTGGTLGITLTTTGTTGDPANRFNNNGWSDRSGEPWVPNATGDNYGLWATSNGAITISNLRVRNNSSYGAYIDNSYGTGGVTLTGSWNGFTDNGGDGLDLFSTGAVAITNPGAWNNSGSGMLIDNSYGNPLAPKNVTFTNTAYFANNGDDGLNLRSYGAILIANLTANDNGQNNFWSDAQDPPLPTDEYLGYGAALTNFQSASPQPITLTGTNTFNGNYQDGLDAVSNGAISVNKLTANWNGQSSTDGYTNVGAYLDNQWEGGVGGVTVSVSSPLDSNNFSNNGADGLVIWSNGAVTLTNINASGNGGDGLFVNTAYWFTGTVHTVTLKGVNAFELNQTNGVEIWADGSITLNTVKSEWNGGDGADLDNCLWGYDPYLDDYACLGHGSITLTGVNDFRHNGGMGLYADTTGTLSASRLTADNNGMEGVYATAYGKITISCGSMVDNGSFGWDMWSPTGILTQGVTAFGNGGTGGSDGNPNYETNGSWWDHPRLCPLP